MGLINIKLLLFISAVGLISRQLSVDVDCAVSKPLKTPRFLHDYFNKEQEDDRISQTGNTTTTDKVGLAKKATSTHKAVLIEMRRLGKLVSLEQQNSKRVELGKLGIGIRSRSQNVHDEHLQVNPDIYLNTPQLITKYGYPVEIHDVTTEDGYILQMHRIPHGKNQSKISRPQIRKRVAFLQHGMFGTSADWILNSVDKSLAYMLADEGYDVWLGNARGNTYSRRHVSLSTKSYAFWRFSWHEMGYYDLPAEIDHVLNVTNSADLYYVGHSMGTTMFFVFLSTRPEYTDKIRFMAALGPAVYLNNTKSVAKYFAYWWGPVEKMFLDTVGHGIFLPNLLTQLINKFAPELCTEELRVDRLCDELMSLLTGHDSAQTNYTQLPVILAHEPSTVSTQTGFHYFQNIRFGGFRMYNKGFKVRVNPNDNDNDNSSSVHLPPEYNLANVVVPVAIFWGQNDILCDPIDVARLARTLPNVVTNFRVNFTLWNHVDFVFAKDVDVLLNRPLIQILSQH